MIIKYNIIFGFGELSLKIRKECGYKFDNNFLHAVVSELCYEGIIVILKIIRKKTAKHKIAIINIYILLVRFSMPLRRIFN